MRQHKKRNRFGKTSGLHRAFCVLLCLVILSGVGQSFFLSVHAQATLSVEIEADGAVRNSLILAQQERVVLHAQTQGQSCTSYQWQILADVKTEQWVNIYDGTEQTLSVSQAMLNEVLDGCAGAYVRCVVTSGEQQGISQPFCITVAQTVSGLDEQTAAFSGTQSGAQVQTGDAPENDAQDMVEVTVNYLDAVSGLAIYTRFCALIERGTAYENTVTSPTYLGYKPFYNAADPDAPFPSDGSEVNAPDEALTVSIALEESYDKASYTVNVYYKASDVPYAVKYFFQNIHDDRYSEESSLYRQGYAKTGTILADADLDLPDGELREGFTKLYHYPQAVAADGSTVFECYYDRNYSMLKFDLDGGYGTEPIYARYGTPFLVNEPTKHGYVFAGWDLLTDGKGDGIPDALPSTVPASGRTYAAIWERAQTKYTVAYWLQNADDDGYSYVASVKQDAKSGDSILAYDALAQTGLCGKTHTHTADCYPSEYQHYVYDQDKTLSANPSVTVKGDGSTVLNIYYTRQYYTLRFVYAKEYNGSKDNSSGRDWEHNDFVGTRYSIIGGSTYHFGNASSSKLWPNAEKGGTAQWEYTFEELIYNIDKREKPTPWGVLYTTENTAGAVADTSYLPQFTEQSKALYSFGAYPSLSSYTDRGDRFYYFDLTARYGADLTDLWPDDVFESIQIENPFSSNKGNQNAGEGEWGNYAYLAGWNGEFKVEYSLKNRNSTVKGLYQKLDDTLLFGTKETSSGNVTFSYPDDRLIRTTPSGKSGTVSSYVNYYLGFFNNGADISWNVPVAWSYEMYVPVFDAELAAIPSQTLAAVKEAGQAQKTYVIDGKTYYYYTFNQQLYRLYNQIDTSDDGWDVTNQTQTQLAGFTFDKNVALASRGNPRTKRSEEIANGTLADKRLSYTARFFYERERFTLTLHNYNESSEPLSIEFDRGLDDYVLDDTGKQKVPEYPPTLEPGAYEFGGWYTSPDCLDGSEYIPASLMPAHDVVLYAKWKPVQHTVRFFRTYDDLLSYEATGNTSGLLASYTVDHGNVISGVKTPQDLSGHNYSFGGWFYMRRGQKTAYTPLDIPVQSDLNVYADWGSFTAQPYRIHYALYQKETDAARLSRLAAAAGSSPVDNTSYQITVDGKEASYVFLEKDGGYHLEIAPASAGYAYQGSTRTFYPKVGDPFNQLTNGYNTGYFPTLASHSITVEYEENKEEPEKNLFTFTYVFAQEIAYTVEYRYLDGNAKIPDTPTEGGDGTVTKTTDKAVITERFAVVKDYIPDAFYKRLILAVDVDADGNVSSSASNLLTFWYSKNEKNAYYAVHYMLQNAEDTSDGTPIADQSASGKYQNYTESTSYTEGIGAIGQAVPIAAQAFVGFEVRASALAFLHRDGTVTKQELSLQENEAGNPYFSLQVEQEGSELYLFYTRKSQSYKVYHLRYGTNVTDLASLSYDKDDAMHENGVLSEILTGEQKYGATVTAEAKTIAGMNCVSALSQSIVLRQNNAQNYIIFYYAPLQYTVEYRSWDYGGGTLSNGIEVLNGIGEFKGSEPTAHTGYEFAGWYLDEACTVPVVSGQASEEDLAVVAGEKLTPVLKNLPAMPKKTVFYAKFLPVLGDLTITRGDASDQSSGTEVFVYRITAKDNPALVNYVTIRGQGSVTVHGLGCRDYIVEQCNDWSWRYADERQEVTLTKAGAELTFDKAAQKDTWLSGNSEPLTNEKDALGRKR